MNKPIYNSTELVSVLMPLYCEGSHIKQVLAQVHDALSAAAITYEIILVDDGSPGDTWDVISGEAELHPGVHAVKLSRNFGKESALCAGLELARGDAVVVMDGDGQHPPALLPEMIRLWRATCADIVEGTKVTRGEETIVGKLSAAFFI